MSSAWKEEHHAFIGITRYVVRKERNVFRCYERKYEPIDCYSNTRVDREYKIGSVRNLRHAKQICIAHEADKERAEE